MARQLEIVEQGIVTQQQPDTPTAVAVGARAAVNSDGQLVCGYMVQSKLGINDFKFRLRRSRDGGRTWEDEYPAWPKLESRYSIFGSISRAPSGELMFFGARTPIETKGESLWSDATMGLKQNELIWSRSRDGRSWAEPTAMPMPTGGSAEAPGPICVTRSGRWLCCYAPYHTFDPNVKVDRQQLALLASDDQGKSWKYTAAMRFAEDDTGCAEAWVAQLADGRLLATAWHYKWGGIDYPNKYALSEDDGRTWSGPHSTNINGQSTALTPLADGRIIMLYNQRKHGEPGVYAAVAKPTREAFNAEINQIVWRADRPSQGKGSGAHDEWTDFNFGEPSAVVLPTGDVMVFVWCIQPNFAGIRSVRVKVGR